MKAGLNPKLLNAMLERIGEKQLTTHAMDLTTQTFTDLVEPSPELVDDQNRLRYINCHLEYLGQEGFITIRERGRAFQRSWIELTSIGHKYLQPELAEFGQRSMLPEVVNSIEKQILTYPEHERSEFLFELRKAIAKNRAELVAKLMVEVLPKLLSGS
jgi:hypothetical protein